MTLTQRIDSQDEKTRQRDATRSKTLVQGLELLKWMADRTGPHSIRETARETGLNVSLVQRLMNSLCDAGFVEQDSTRRYRIGVGALRVGQAFLSETGLVEFAGPILRELSMRESLNSYLAILRDDQCLYLCVEQSAGALTVHSAPGARAPVHTTAIGKALLAGLPDHEVKALLSRTRPKKLTERTRVSFTEIVTELNEIRSGALAVCDEENIPGLFAIGAPVLDITGRTVAGVSCACAAHLARGEGRKRIADAVRQASRDISLRMGAPLSVIERGGV